MLVAVGGAWTTCESLVLCELVLASGLSHADAATSEQWSGACAALLSKGWRAEASTFYTPSNCKAQYSKLLAEGGNGATLVISSLRQQRVHELKISNEQCTLSITYLQAEITALNGDPNTPLDVVPTPDGIGDRVGVTFAEMEAAKEAEKAAKIAKAAATAAAATAAATVIVVDDSRGQKRRREDNETEPAAKEPATPAQSDGMPTLEQPAASEVEGETPKTPATAEVAASVPSLSEMMQKIKKHDDANPFMLPVDPKEVPDYANYITVPMDMQTIDNKISTGALHTPQQLQEHVTLMFGNAFKYNHSKSEIYQMAKRMLAFCDQLIKASFTDLTISIPEGDGGEQPQPINAKPGVGKLTVNVTNGTDDAAGATAATPTTPGGGRQTRGGQKDLKRARTSTRRSSKQAPVSPVDDTKRPRGRPRKAMRSR